MTPAPGPCADPMLPSIPPIAVVGASSAANIQAQHVQVNTLGTVMTLMDEQAHGVFESRAGNDQSQWASDMSVVGPHPPSQCL